MPGELTLDTLKKFEEKYKATTRNLPKNARPSEESEHAMYSLIGLKDPSTRQSSL